MARYIVRIETRGASQDVVRGVEAAMRRSGFTQAIQGDDGRVFHLPSETYVGDFVQGDAVGVKDAVVKLAKALCPQAWVLVTQGLSAWQTEEVPADRRPDRLS